MIPGTFLTMTKAIKSEDGDGRRTKYLHEKVTAAAVDRDQRRAELQRIYERASDLAMQLGFAF